jgi:hypothetical protein
MTDERKRRAPTIAYLQHQGAIEGEHWRFADSPDAWAGPGVLDVGDEVDVTEQLRPQDPSAIPILINAAGVRLLGAPRTAVAMESGALPAEMPFVIYREQIHPN